MLMALLGGLAAQGQPAGNAAAGTAPAPMVVTPPAREKFHIYLLMGQSNMVGRDVSTLASQTENPRVLALNADGHWVVARDPLHPQVGNIAPGAGLGIPFAVEMLKGDANITIGLVPCAVGGTALSRWVKGADLYENAVKLARQAAQSGTLSGVLWHQGESDTSTENNAKTYAARLTKMFADLRQDLGTPDLPVVVGQLGAFLTVDKYPYVDTVRSTLKNIPTVVPHAGYADSAGLSDKGDQLHFNAAAQKEFGVRYAKAMAALAAAPAVTPSPAPAAAPTAPVAIWPEGKMPGKGAADPEAERPSTDGFHRITNVSNPTLTIYPAPAKNGVPAPAMIVCPGGGYSYVVIDKEGSEIATWLNTLGITGIVLKYRNPNNRPGAMQDVQRALSVARAHAAEWKIDPKRLGVIGFSAGGHLAAKASTQFDQRTYSAIDDVDLQSCRPDFAVLVYPAYLDDRQGGLSPELNLKAAIPPTLIVHNEDDKTYNPGSKLYNAALDALKVPHQFAFYQTGGHGYGLHCTGEAKAWPQAAAEWFQTAGVK